jgi:hypothetical protein
MLPVQSFINYFVEIWKNSSIEMPVFEKEFPSIEKLEREIIFNQFEKEIKTLQHVKNISQIRSNPGNSFFPIFKGLLETIFDFKKEHLAIILSEEYKNVSTAFFYKARYFGNELSLENIYQGLRNVWIMNGIQQMLNVPIKITPSVFAYSMIYPYSDNLLDDPLISAVEKQQFNNRFNLRLHGEDCVPQSFTEEQLFKLVAMFEDEFERNAFPNVYESLYAIHRGQSNSLKLMLQHTISDAEVINICFEKGGASVLADGFLVAGKLTDMQQRALFGFGIYLQLLDDIQDIKEDTSSNTKTMCSFLEQAQLGEFVNKTIWFGRQVLSEMQCITDTVNNNFVDLMKRSIETMLIESVGLNSSAYTEKYLNELERYSPLHFDFVRQKRAQSKSHRFALLQKYFSTVKIVQPV